MPDCFYRLVLVSFISVRCRYFNNAFLEKLMRCILNKKCLLSKVLLKSVSTFDLSRKKVPICSITIAGQSIDMIRTSWVFYYTFMLCVVFTFDLHFIKPHWYFLLYFNYCDWLLINDYFRISLTVWSTTFLQPNIKY